jgi:hypothetical protein
MFIVNYLKTIAFCVSLVFLHSSYASAAGEFSLSGHSAAFIKDTAINVHQVARSTAPAGTRLIELSVYITALQEFSDRLRFEHSVRRYMVLLECFAWDLYEVLLRNLGSQRSFNHQRPSVARAAEYVHLVITEDIQNPALKEILSEMSTASTQGDKTRYTALAEELEHLGETLSGAEKREFEFYRMVLGPQFIELPWELTR